MAIQKSIVDRFGATHATSYTRINQINLNSESAIIEIIMYHDAAARSKGDSVSAKPSLHQTSGRVSDADFATFFQDSVLDNNDISPLK